jgi:hypothetical protein
MSVGRRLREFRPKLASVLTAAALTPGLATGWAIGGEILKEELRKPHSTQTAQRSQPGGLSFAEQIYDLTKLNVERKSGAIGQLEYEAERAKVLAQPITR